MQSFCCGSKGILPEGLRSDASEFMQSAKSSVFGSAHAPSAPRRWDICIVAQPLELTAAQTEKMDPVEQQAKLADFAFKGKQRKDAYAKLRRAGIELHFFCDDTKEIKPGETVSQFVLLSIPDDLLKSTAARIGLEKQLKPVYAENDKRTDEEHIEYTPFREYTKETHDEFLADQSSPDSFFTSLERLKCLYYLIEGNSDDLPKPASLDLDLLVSQGIFEQYFSLKDKPRVEELSAEWVYSSGFSKPPVTLIREYLGPKVALYFAWLHMYTYWLGILGALSLVPWLYSLSWSGSPTGTPYDNWAMPIYGVLSVVWAQLFLEAWKREQAVYQFLWNTEDFEHEEITRPEYVANVLSMIQAGPVEGGRQRLLYERALNPVKARMRTGVWSQAGFVSVEHELQQLGADAAALKDATTEQAWFNPRIRRWRLLVTTVLGGLIFAFIAVVTIALQGLKTYIAHEGGPVYQDFAQVIAALCQSLFITLMSFAWAQVGVALNDWEMHRTDTEWEDALITKTFAFQFVNSYGAAIYIAFMQGAHFSIPGLYVHDSAGELVPLRDSCLEDKCYKAIYLQMLIIILSKQVSRNILAVVPIVVNFVKARCCAKPTQSSDMLHATVIEESQLAKFGGTHHEFIEMAIQFGYVSIFAVAFPLGSIVCWINNLLEKRADAAKVALFMQRPRPLSASDIGTVQNILEAIGVLAVFANVGILYLSSEAYYAYFPTSWGERPNFKVFVFSVVLEHLILLMKQVVAQVVPDTPAWVAIERTRAEMLVDVARKSKLRQDKTKHESDKALHERAYEQAMSKFNRSDTAFEANDKDYQRAI